MYSRHNYPNTHMWNNDESKAQIGRNGGAHVLTRRGIRSMHIVMPHKRKKLSILFCINALVFSIPNFNIFKGRLLRNNFIIRYEEEVCMAMEKHLNGGSTIQ